MNDCRKTFERILKKIYGAGIFPITWDRYGKPVDCNNLSLKNHFKVFLAGRQYEKDKVCSEFAKEEGIK